jgi:formylglycine-generating enzyme required for sulfatase activity
MSKNTSAIISPKQGSVWKDPVTHMSFIWIEHGCFMMGQTESEKRQLIQEALEEIYNKYFKTKLPLHEVNVDGFWIGQYQVTVGQFRRFVQETGYKTEAEKEGWAWFFDGKDWEKENGVFWQSPGFSQEHDHPVVCVSWNDAMALCQWLNNKGNGTFRLPTETEWEYACRGGTKSIRFWGDDPDMACQYANVCDKTFQKKFPDLSWKSHDCDCGYVFTSPAGIYQPNPFNLYDMLGNVWEWCMDHFSEDAYNKHEHDSPIYEENGVSFRVVRGGGWFNARWFVRSAGRYGFVQNDRYGDLGFRLLRTIKP